MSEQIIKLCLDLTTGYRSAMSRNTLHVMNQQGITLAKKVRSKRIYILLVHLYGILQKVKKKKKKICSDSEQTSN